MISASAAAEALGRRLQDLYLPPAVCQYLGAQLPLPVGWENKDLPHDTPHPFLLFEAVPVTRKRRTLKRALVDEEGFVMVTVVSKLNAFADHGCTVADAVVQLFPANLRLAVPSGELCVIDEPAVLRGVRDEAHYRTPVRVPYRVSWVVLD